MTNKQSCGEVSGPPKYVTVNRAQLAWVPMDLERLIPVDHLARAIWHLSGQLDFGHFEREIQTREGEAGRPCWEPRLLASIWVYAYSQGIASARDLERRMEYEPGLQWLCGGQVVNAHSLSDFRMTHKGKLNHLLAQLLALLEQEGMIELETVMQDGTKVRAAASPHSLHRRRTLEQRLEMARQRVEELSRRGEQEEGGEGAQEKQKGAARQRAAEARLQRMEESLRRLRQLEAQPSGAREAAELRISDSEPEARKMKHSDGGWAPSYNVQISTDAKHRIIVGVRVSSEPNDTQELIPALHMIRHLCHKQPQRMVADNGYASRENVEAMAKRKVEWVSPWKADGSREAGALATHGIDAAFGASAFVADGATGELLCPAGKRLAPGQPYQHHGQRSVPYTAQAADCGACAYRERCCGAGRAGPRRVSRIEESPAMRAYLERMKQPETQILYKRRKEVGEFAWLWIKGVWGLRRFSVRGLAKVAKEALWEALAYNIQQWARIVWRPQLA